MSAARQILDELRDIGVEVAAVGDMLRIQPASAVPPELKRRLKEEKEPVLDLLRQESPPEPDGPWPTQTWGPLYVEHFLIRILADLDKLPAASVAPSPEPAP